MPIRLRADFDAGQLRSLARRTKDAAQARRLLALAAVYDGGTRTDAAKIGGVILQIVRDWVLKFNDQGPDGLIDRKPPGQLARLNGTHRAALAAVIESGPTTATHGVVRWRLVDLCQWMAMGATKPPLIRPKSQKGDRAPLTIVLQLVRDDDAWDILQATQQPFEEALRRLRVSPALDEDVDYDAVLIYGTPEVVQFALDPDEDLVQESLVARSRASPTQAIRKAVAELPAPAQDGLVGDGHASFSQQQLAITQAEAEHMIEPNGVADGLRSEAMAIVRVGLGLHPAILA